MEGGEGLGGSALTCCPHTRKVLRQRPWTSVGGGGKSSVGGIEVLSGKADQNVIQKHSPTPIGNGVTPVCPCCCSEEREGRADYHTEGSVHSDRSQGLTYTSSLEDPCCYISGRECNDR